MGAAKKILDKKALQSLVPFNALSPAHLAEVSQKTQLEEVAAGRYIFREGDRDNQSVYVLEGEVNLVSGDKVMGTVKGGEDSSRHPLAHQQPRQISARAKTKVTLARIDSSFLDIFLTWDQSSGYEVAEINDEDDDDWMTKMLQSKAFLRLPPSNIQRLLMSVESIDVPAGEKIIEQGAEGDYFYVITRGRCAVTRRPSPNAKEVKLAELSDGDAFGEDALVSDAKRNATITMLTDGSLVRLAKKDFVELLKEPLVNKLAYPAAREMVDKGEAVWLDVRLPGEFENRYIPGAQNVPLSALRLEASQLPNDKKYIMCCDTGSRSASAAFLLSQNDLEVYVLEGGVAGVPAEALEGEGATQPVAPPPAKDQQAPKSADVVELPVPDTGAEAREATAEAQQDYGKELARFRQFREDATAKIRETREQIKLAEEAKKAAEMSLAEARQELEAAKSALAEQEQKANDAAAASAERDSLKAKVAELEQALSAAQSTGASAEEQQQALASSLNEQQQAVADLQTQLKERESAFNTLQQQLADRDRDLETLKQELANAREAGHQADSEHNVHLEALQNDLASAREERDQARSTLAEVEKQSQSDRQAHVSELQHLQTDLQEKDQRLSQLEGELEQARQAHQADLESRSQTATEQEQGLRAEIDQLNQSLQQVREELDAAQSQNTELKQYAESTESDLKLALDEAKVAADGQAAELQSQIDSLTEQLHAAQAHEARVKDLEATLAQLESDRESLQEERDQAQQTLQMLEQDKVAMDQELADLQAALENSEREHQQKREAIVQEKSAADEQLETLVSELEQTTASLSDAQKQLQDVQTSLEQERKTVSELQAQMETAQQESQSALEVQQGATAAAEQRLAELEAEKQQLSEKIASFEAKIAEGSASLDDQQKQLSELEQANAELTASLQSVQQARDEAEQRSATLQEEQQQQQTALAEKQTALEEANARIVELESAGQALESEKSEQANSLTQLRSEIEEKSTRLDELEKALGEAEQAVLDAQQQAEAKQTEFADQLEALRTEASEATTELDKMRSELAAAEESHKQAAASLETERAEAAQRQAQFTAEIEEKSAALEALQKSLAEAEQSANDSQQQAEARQAELVEELEALRKEASDASSELEKVRDLAAKEREAASKTEDALRSELEVVKASLSHEQSARGSGAASMQAESEQRIAELSSEITELRTEAQQQVQTLEQARQDKLEAEEQCDMMRQSLNEAQETAQEREQALQAELEQLREATSADVAALQQQIADLKSSAAVEETVVDNTEVERLQLLLNEARDQANQYRSELEVLQASQSDMELGGNDDEIERLQQELMALKAQMDDAANSRSEAEEEVSRLQEQLIISQAQQAPDQVINNSRAASAPEPEPQVVMTPPPQSQEGKRSGGLIMGLIGGLVIGAAVAGGALWYQQQGSTILQTASVAGEPDEVTAALDVVEQAQEPKKKIDPVSDLKSAPKPEPTKITASQPKNPKPVIVRDQLNGAPTPTLVRVSATEFMMGGGASSLEFDERPRHSVKLPAFAISQTEITFKQYDAFASATGRALPDDEGWGRGDRPVVNVSWEDATAYTDWLSKQTGRNYRLPTEAEWEYAAGANSSSLYWWGSSIGDNRANCFNCGSRWDGSQTAPVGSFEANSLGLKDTAGNVSEWVMDCYHDSYEGAPADGSAWVEPRCSRRVVRGGAFDSTASSLRFAKRANQYASTKLNNLGFRVVRE